ncbi:hypothetical protein VNI00_010495 [Paramarasmius palmivorus]|uniref:Uncharacterized protein n=1 Tax=Paramarasmius palmivorus TaxID=297713 RepID=A0AAW0CG75_9AGAR
MAKTPNALIDPDTGKPYRMCRKCGNSSPPHAMKHCSSYRRPVKNNAKVQDSSVPLPISSESEECTLEESTQDSPANTSASPPPKEQLCPQNESEDMAPSPASVPRDSNETSEGQTQEQTPDSVIDPALLALSAPQAATVHASTATQPTSQTDTDILSTPTRPRSKSTSPESPLRLMGSEEAERLLSPTTTTTSTSAGATSGFCTTPSSSVATSSPLSTPSKPRRRRPTKADPCYGEVVGAYRGNKVLTIRRTRQPTEDKIRAKKQQKGEADDLDRGVNIPKVFYDRTRSLVTQMHDLAEITGSWLHFSAQHPTASQPFIHYTSKRLRSEGGELLDNLHQANHELYQSLMTARRCDTTQLAAQLAKVTERLAQVEADAQARIAEANAAKLAAEAATAELRSMVVAANTLT